MQIHQETGEIAPWAWLAGAALSVTVAVAPFSFLRWLDVMTAAIIATTFGVVVVLCFLAAGRQHYINVGRDRERTRTEVAPEKTPPLRNGRDTTPDEAQERIVIDVDVAFLLGIINSDHTTAEMQRLIKPYLGKWMRVGGPIHDISESTLALSNYFTPAGLQAVYLHFDLAWTERLLVQRRGSSVNVLGQIVRADRVALVLKHCELT